MEGLAQAQRNYDRQLPELYDAADELERVYPFSDSDVEHFISDFSKSDGDAESWLQDQGVDKTCVATAEMLRAMCRAFLVNPNAVYAVAGLEFWRECKKLAYEIWSK